MRQLFISEWQRVWNRKSTWISFMLIPIVLVAIIKHYIKSNALITSDNLKYVSSYNFPSRALNDESIVIFDIIMIVLVIMSITSEYREGKLRMVMIRSFSFGEIFKAKYLVVLSTAALLLFTNFIFSTFLGYLALPNQGVKFSYYLRKFTVSESVLYNIKYYIIAFVILAAVVSVIMCIATICKTTIGALAGSLVFMLVSTILPDLCSVFISKVPGIYEFMNNSFLTSIQYGGIDVLLSQTHQGVGVMLTSVGFHIVVFYLIAFYLFSDEDCYI